MTSQLENKLTPLFVEIVLSDLETVLIRGRVAQKNILRRNEQLYFFISAVV